MCLHFLHVLRHFIFLRAFIILSALQAFIFYMFHVPSLFYVFPIFDMPYVPSLFYERCVTNHNQPQQGGINKNEVE